MKSSLLIVFGLLLIPIIGFVAYNAMTAPLPEGFPPPTAAGRIEVKRYPAYRAGTVTYEGQLSQATSATFNPLFKHISSNNIPMTTPVEARYPMTTLQGTQGADEWGQAEVSFLYRTPEVQPQQVDSGIEVEDHPPMTVVSIGIQGSYTYVSYQQHLEQLRVWLAQHPEYAVNGLPRRFFYNSPFTPDALKQSEVQIPIRATNQP